LQVEDYQGEKNIYYHGPGDNIAHMNLDYWLEQMRATVAIAAHLAIPITKDNKIYLPSTIR
jgi:hypothetical protein